MLTVLIPESGMSWSAFLRRIQETDGEILVVLPEGEWVFEAETELEVKKFFEECGRLSDRVRIATFNRHFSTVARGKGIRVYDQAHDVRALLEGHPRANEAMRILLPGVWRQQLRSRLQTMGLLSLPKLRIWILIAVSAVLLLFILFRLLPSTEIQVWPRGDTVTQTVNIFLVQPGAAVDISNRVRVLELIPHTVELHRTITFDQISKEFVGSNAEVAMTIVNASNRRYELRGDSRLTNQAGMIFRIQEPVKIDPGEEITVRAVADDLDLYGEIIGERGNVPAGLRWEFPGLAAESRTFLYGENRAPATGGTSEYTTVLKQRDLDMAERQLKKELQELANQLLDEERVLYNALHPDRARERLYYDIFTSATYSGIVLPVQFLGEKVTSVPVEGSIAFTAFEYDKQAALVMLVKELEAHVGEGRELVEESITPDLLIHHVINYADDHSWIKLTVDLSAKEMYMLDPLTPSGARFAMKVRELVAGKTRSDAERIVKNLREVDGAKVSLWPPWSRTLPTIPSHISVIPVLE